MPADAFALQLADLLDPQPSPAQATAARFMHDPLGWAQACIDWSGTDGLTAYQAELLGALPVHHRIAVRGPHGLGKTLIDALAVHWFALTRDLAGVDWKCITTAGAWGQLERYLWPEVHKWAGRIKWDVVGRGPYGSDELLKLSLQLEHGAASAAASSNPALIEGAHADSVLYIFDEAKAIPVEVFDAAEGAFSAARPLGLPEAFAIANSTPGEPAGRFHAIHTRRPGLEDWHARHVTLAETIKAGRVSPEWAQQRAALWGATSAIYANRVLGEFAASDEDTVLPLAWVELAVERWRDWHAAGRPVQPHPFVLGVDVADTGQDRTAIATRAGDVVLEVVAFPHGDPMETAGRVKARWDHPSTLVVVDSIGVGSGVLARLREQQVRASGFVASGKSEMTDRHGLLGMLNARAAAWWRVRELLDPATHPTLCLPDDEQLIGELCAPHWKLSSAGKVQIEAKDDIRSRLGRSTDLADAVVMACTPAVDASAAHAYYAGHEPDTGGQWPARRDPDDLDTPWWEQAEGVSAGAW